MRTTQRNVDHALREFTDLLASEVGRPVRVTLHRGNSSYKIANTLLVDGSNLWPNGIGGTTTTAAWVALRAMVAGMAVVSDIRENDRLRDQRATSSTKCDGLPLDQTTCPDRAGHM